MGSSGFIGDDGAVYGDPCTSKRGRQKKRWPNEDAAWFVVDLAKRGLYEVAKRQRLRLYPYHCPKCGGWHTASAGKDPVKLKRHREGLAAWRERQGKDRK